MIIAFFFSRKRLDYTFLFFWMEGVLKIKFTAYTYKNNTAYKDKHKTWWGMTYAASVILTWSKTKW